MSQGATHDDFETRYWLRTAAAGGWVTLLMSGAGVAYLILFTEPGHRLWLGLMLAFAIAFGLLALFVVPWERIVASRWRERAFLCWSLLTVVMVWLLALADGGHESPLPLALVLPMVFVSLSFPIRYVVATGALAELAFVTLALGDGLPGAYILVFSSVLAGSAAMALWQAKNHDGWRQELARSSTTDPLTHLLNRRGFAMASDRAFAALARKGTPITLAVIDLDYLKAYNDQNGHQAGDELLCWGRRAALECGAARRRGGAARRRRVRGAPAEDSAGRRRTRAGGPFELTRRARPALPGHRHRPCAWSRLRRPLQERRRRPLPAEAPAAAAGRVASAG